MSVSRYNGDTPRGLEVFAMKKNAMNPHRLAVLAMMTAVVFAVNFPRIIIPLPTGETSFTLANIACVLSGMLLGPLGGLASGLGSAPIPTAIIGGVSFILYGMISAIGVRNVVENRVDFTNSRNLIIAAVILVCGLGFSGGITFPVGGAHVTLTNLAIAAIAGIALNAILPGKDYEFGSDVTEGRSGDFGRY